MRGDLDFWSNLWFRILIGSTILVGIGIICEAPEVFHAIGLGHETLSRIRRFWYIKIRKINLNGWEQLCPELITHARHNGRLVAAMGLIGWTLVALGVAGEGVAEYFVNDAETDIRAFDKGALTETQRYANSASNAASLANDFSKKAEVTSGNAIAQSGRALHEADSFERDIVSAKRQAADAEAHLADALKQVVEAKKELELLRTPRTLTYTPEIISALLPFKGTKYMFFGLFGDEESTGLLRQIDEVLQNAKWTRVQPKTPLPPAFNVSLGDVSIAVSQRFDTGVKITIETESVASLQSLSLEQLSSHVRAARSLRANLVPNIFPPQNGIGEKVDTLPGNELLVLITVGKKP